MSKKINVNQTKFNALWKKHAPKARVTEPNAADLVALLVHSSLLYDATRKQADEATQRIRSSRRIAASWHVEISESRAEASRCIREVSHRLSVRRLGNRAELAQW